MDINHSKVIRATSLGNGLAALQDVTPGEAIIRISSPFIAVVERAALTTACSYCLYGSTSLKRCSKCKVAQYCSSNCQVLSWNSEHKKECAVLKTLSNVPPTAVRALIQVLQSHRFGTSPDPRWANLETNLGELKKSKRWEEITMQAQAGIAFSKVPVTWSDVAIGVLCRMTANAFRIVLADNTNIGLCFEPVLALANHSCTPNANVTFDGRNVTLRALNEIKKDEQIFISYIDPTLGRETRQAELENHYLFTCRCDKCEKDEDPYTSWQKHTLGPQNSKLELLIPSGTLRSLARAATTLHLPSTSETRYSSSTPPSSETLKHALLSPASPPYPAILHDHYLQYLEKSSFGSALIMLLFIHLNSDPFLYPQPHHPTRVIRLFTIAKLCLQMLLPDTRRSLQGLNGICREAMEGVDWISAAQTLLILVVELGEKSHGAESRFVREVREELWEVEAVQRERGVVGEALRAWAESGNGGGEGRMYAEKVFEGLRVVGGRASVESVFDGKR